MVPCGSESFSVDAQFAGFVPLEQIESDAVEQGEVLCGVSGTLAAQILAEGHVQHPVQFVVSRPGGFHPQPLSERCGSLSTHTAPIKQTRLLSHFASVQTDGAVSLPLVPGRDWSASCAP